MLGPAGQRVHERNLAESVEVQSGERQRHTAASAARDRLDGDRDRATTEPTTTCHDEVRDAVAVVDEETVDIAYLDAVGGHDPCSPRISALPLGNRRDEPGSATHERQAVPP